MTGRGTGSAGTVGVLRETQPGERRVALVPAALPALAAAGFGVVVEAGAGEAAGFPDGAYREHGAGTAVSRDAVLAADVLARVRVGAAELRRARPGQVVVGLADPLGNPMAVQELAALGLTVFALELLPRTTRAQTMDALSSQATVAGYKAAVLAAAHLAKLFPLLTTAAGTITPARVLVLGAGVAGLQAIATARRLGAVVEGYDVRRAAREQVESLGARFLDLPLEAADTETAGGYARELGEEFHRRQRDLLARAVAGSDAVIATAQVPGRRAPVLVTASMVGGMAPGSVIVDVAAAQGGNCELTRPDEPVTTGGVTVLGPTNLPATVPYHASQLYSRNIASFLAHLADGGRVLVDETDEIARATLVAHEGEVAHGSVRALLHPGAKEMA